MLVYSPSASVFYIYFLDSCNTPQYPAVLWLQGIENICPCKTWTHTILAFYIVFDFSRPGPGSTYALVCMPDCLTVCLSVTPSVGLSLCLCVGRTFPNHWFCALWQFCWPYWPSHTAIYTNASHCIIHFVVVSNGSTVFKFVLCFALDCISTSCWSHTHTCTATATGYLSYVGHTGCGIRGCDCAASCVYDAHTHTHLIEEFPF